MLNDLQDATTAPVQLFPSRDPLRSAKLMGVMDSLNGRFGRGMIRPAVSGVERRWTARRSIYRHVIRRGLKTFLR